MDLVPKNFKIKLMNTYPTYSKKQFDSYTHRFKVEFETIEWHTHCMDIYSNSGNAEKLSAFIDKNKSDKVVSFKIIHTASKEQDELTSKFIDETLINI